MNPDLGPDAMLFGPGNIIYGRISSFRVHLKIRKKGSAKTPRNLIGSLIIVEITLSEKIQQAVTKLRNKFKSARVRRITEYIVRITFFIRKKLYNPTGYLQARRHDIQNALASQRYPKKIKNRKIKFRPASSIHTESLIASLIRAQ